jgi:hypothetical protein
MLKDAEGVAEFEREQARRGRSYDEALRLFESLWQEARALGSVGAGDPLRGLDADIELARTLNGLRSSRNV